jgi:hypothetical protein
LILPFGIRGQEYRKNKQETAHQVEAKALESKVLNSEFAEAGKGAEAVAWAKWPEERKA